VDFVLTIISLYYLHQALGGGLSQACVKVRAAETSGLAALIQRGGSSSVLAGAPYTVDWSGPNAVGTTHRTGVLDANGEFFDRQPISAFGTYNVLAAVTSSGLTRSVSGMLNVTGAPGTCPAP